MCIPNAFEKAQLESSTNETLRVKDGVSRVHRCLIFSSVTDQTLLSGEGNIGRRCPISLCEQQ
jgi:hypothetical protein